MPISGVAPRLGRFGRLRGRPPGPLLRGSKYPIIRCPLKASIGVYGDLGVWGLGF